MLTNFISFENYMNPKIACFFYGSNTALNLKIFTALFVVIKLFSSYIINHSWHTTFKLHFRLRITSFPKVRHIFQTVYKFRNLIVYSTFQEFRLSFPQAKNHVVSCFRRIVLPKNG